jgi:hypothetical protein
MEATMRPSAQTGKQPGYLLRVSQWFRSWTGRHWRTVQSAAHHSADVRATNDIDLTMAKLQVLAGKWPDSAEVLWQRIPQINRDATRSRG